MYIVINILSLVNLIINMKSSEVIKDENEFFNDN